MRPTGGMTDAGSLTFKMEEHMTVFRRSALAAALSLAATACGSTTGPEDNIVRMLATIYESPIVVPDTVEVGVPFDVDFDVNCHPAFEVVIDLEYYAAEVVVLPSCVGNPIDLAGTGLATPRTAHIDVIFETPGHRAVNLVGRNGTFERTVHVVE